jgi:hypothetical protein
MKLKLFFIFCLILVSNFSFLNSSVYGQHFESDSYIIDWGNFNMTSGSKQSTNYHLTDTVGQNAPGQYDSDGYILKSGFQYIYEQSNQLSFAIDNLNIAFGSLVPGIGTTLFNTITISTPSGHGYEIFAHQNHPLQTAASNQIPDTQCDNTDCDQSTSGVWTLDTTYGFGFNAIGIDQNSAPVGIGTSQYFPDSTYFRQFADVSASEDPQIIMSQNLPVEDQSALISYKINISSSQAGGNYQNAIIFTAVPKY